MSLIFIVPVWSHYIQCNSQCKPSCLTYFIWHFFIRLYNFLTFLYLSLITVLAVFTLSRLQHKAFLYLTIFNPNSLIINRYTKMQMLIFYCCSSRYVNHIAITTVHTGSDALTNALILKCDASFFLAQYLSLSFWSNSEKPNSCPKC